MMMMVSALRRLAATHAPARLLTALVCMLALFGCANSVSSDEHTGAAHSALQQGTPVSTDMSAYGTVPATVVVTYSGLPGNQRDWVAIAQDGSPLSSYVQWQYTNGAGTSSPATATFSNLPVGVYVARTFINDMATLSGESASFTVGSSVTTSATNYASAATVTVNYTGLPGNPRDWIAISAAGSPDTSFVQYVYTNGAVSGQTSFTGIADGAYVARAYSNDTFTKLAESATFYVGAAVAPSAPAYAAGAAVTINYSGAPGNPMDWVAVAAAGSPDTSYAQYAYTNGAVNGSTGFSNLANGTYVARLFSNNTFTKLAQSTTFVVGQVVTTDNSTYASGTNVVASWANLPGNARDWIAIATPGAPDTSYVTWVYTNGAVNGSYSFPGLADGTYVARAYLNDGFTRLAESASFSIGPVYSQPTVTTNASTYQRSDTVTVNYYVLPGNPRDWIAISAAGSPDTSYVQFAYTNGAVNGTAPFTNLPPGSYVARAYSNDTFTKLAESATFTVTGAAPSVSTDMTAYPAGATVNVPFDGMPGNARDWIAISTAGSPDTSYVVYQYTSGAISGTFPFPGLANGTYVARAYSNDTYTKLAESPQFTVGP
jgi:hypothetical protein